MITWELRVQVVRNIRGWQSLTGEEQDENNLGWFRIENLSSDVLPRIGETVQIDSELYPREYDAVLTTHSGNGQVFQVEHRLGSVPVVSIAGETKMSAEKLAQAGLPGWPLSYSF